MRNLLHDVGIKPLRKVRRTRSLATIAFLLALIRPAHADDTQPEPLYSKEAAALILGGTWFAVGTWAYFAWFYDTPRLNDPRYVLEGFGKDTYAGGADKMGHAWASYALTRLTAKALVYGGWRRWPASLVAAGIKLAFSTLSEWEDSYVYEFEFGDVIANFTGAVIGVAMENLPTLDRYLDFRLQYFPSADYRHQVRHMSDVDLAQDYSGQSYMLAFHLGGPQFDDEPRWLSARRFVDVVVGFESRNYKPVPRDPTAQREQILYAGIAIDFQGVLRELFCDTPGRRAGETAFELLSVPYTTLRVGELSR